MVRWTKRSEKSNAEIMDFENVNSMNRQLNLISGNLFPMTANGFTIGWRIYSIAVWLLMTVECIAFFSGCAMVPKEKNINNGMTVMLFNVEVFSLITRIHVKRGLIMQFIRGMNDSLRTRDKIMKRIVMKVVRQMQTPIKFYLLIGQLTMTIWILLPLGEIGKKSFFSYVDYKIPNAISKQPFSAMTFVLGIMLTLFADVYLLTKKLSLDSYVVHMVQLMTAQYQYIALKLAEMFQNGMSENDYKAENKHQHEIDQRMKREIRALCLRHNGVTQMSFILKELLSFHVSVTYICNILRYCCIGVMALDTISRPLYEYVMVLLYLFSSIVEFCMVCFCVQELLNASKELTDKAFHEDWFRCRLSIKRTFLLMITANKLECKLAKVGNFNLALPSFLMIFKQAYAFAVLFLKIRST